MHYTYSLPFVNVSRTPIDEPAVKVEYHYRDSVVRFKTKAGTFSIPRDELGRLISVLRASNDIKLLCQQLDKYDAKEVLTLLGEVISDTKLHAACA